MTSRPYVEYTQFSTYWDHLSPSHQLGSYTSNTPIYLDVPSPFDDLESLPRDDDDLSQLLHPSHASNAKSFFPSSVGLDSLGFLVVRVIENGHCLELRWCGLICKQDGEGDEASEEQDEVDDPFEELDGEPVWPAVRIRLGLGWGKVVPGIGIYLDHDSDLRKTTINILALTTSGILHKFRFRAPSFFYSDLSTSESFDWNVQYRIDGVGYAPIPGVGGSEGGLVMGKRPVLMHLVEGAGAYAEVDENDDREGKAIIVIGCADGTMLKVEQNGNNFQTSTLRIPSLLRSLASLLPLPSLPLPSTTSSPSQAIDFVSQPSSTRSVSYGFSITRERKLRIWNLFTGVGVKAVNLPVLKSSNRSQAQMEVVRRDDGQEDPKEEGNKDGETGQFDRHPRNLMRIIQAPSGANSGVLSGSGSTGDDFTSYLAIFIPADGFNQKVDVPGLFLVYGITCDEEGQILDLLPVLERSCDFVDEQQGRGRRSSDSTLVDFWLVKGDPADVRRLSSASSRTEFASEGWTRYTLWTLWEERGEGIVRFVSIDLPGQDESDVQEMVETGNDSVMADGDTSIISRRDADTTVADSTFSESPADAWITVRSPYPNVIPNDPNPSPWLTKEWNTRYFDSLPIDSSSEGIVETFSKHIFWPGRYTPTILASALHAYEDQLFQASTPVGPPDALLREHNTLAERIVAVVGCSLQLEQSSQTGAYLYEEFNKALRREWMGFIIRCEELRKQGGLPVALVCEEEFTSPIGPGPKGRIFVMNRDSIAMPTVMDPSLTLSILRDGAPVTRSKFLSLPSPALTTLYPQLAPGFMRQDILLLLRASRTLVSSLPSESIVALETDLFNAGKGPRSWTLEEAWDDLWDRRLSGALTAAMSSEDDGETDDGSVMAIVRNQLTAANDLRQALLNVYEIVRNEEDVVPVSQLPSHNSRATDLSLNLIVDAVTFTAEARQAILRDVLILLLFIWGQGLPLLDDSSDLLATGVSIFHALSVVRWTVRQSMAGQSPGGSASIELADRFESMHVSKNIGQASPAFSILSRLTQDLDFPSNARLVSVLYAPSAAFANTVSSWLRLADLMSGVRSKALHTATDGDVRFAHRLQLCGLSSAAMTVTRMYPRGAGMRYVYALASVACGDLGEASLAFEQAAVALYEGEDDVDRLSTESLPSIGAATLFDYYRQVTALFENKDADDHVVKFCRLAVQSLPSGGLESVAQETTRPSKEVWLKLFRSQMALGQFEDAYTTIIEFPHEEIKSEALRQLIAVMCDNGAIDQLLSFSFVGLQSEVESILSFRARNADPTSSPNFAEVLYAFHVSKSDYRSAAAVMYQHSHHVADVSIHDADFGLIATLQCQSLLAAVNALSLGDPEHAWFIASPARGKDTIGRKRRKVGSHFSADERVQERHTADANIIGINDVRQEYFTMLHRLQLAGEFPEVASSNLEPIQLVSLISQTGSVQSAFDAAMTFAVDMTNLFQHVAIKCVRLTKSGDMSRESDIYWVLSDENASSWEGSIGSRAWRLLQSLIDRYDREEGSHYKYREVVLDAILHEDRHVRLPTWLVDDFLERNPDYLIRRLIAYNVLQDAFGFSLQVISRAAAALTKQATTLPSPLSFRLPYQAFDSLLSAEANEGDPEWYKAKVKALQTELRSALDVVFDKLGILERSRAKPTVNVGR